MIQEQIPDAQVMIRDLTGGGDHLEAVVISGEFAGKSCQTASNGLWCFTIGTGYRSHPCFGIKNLHSRQLGSRKITVISYQLSVIS
jgi:hypothetical protein